MRESRGWIRQGLCLVAAILLAFATCLPALAEQERTYVEPRYPSGAPEYDETRPEELSDDQILARSAILIEATTGEVIFEKDADAVMYPASTTKILTVLLGIMMGDMNATCYLSEAAANIEDSADMGLDVGESINFRDLLYGTFVRSANEGANMIAEAVSGSIEAFTQLMNEAAAMYGCTSTNFANPNGLFNENHYSTARDIAKLAQAAMQNETFRDIAKTYTYSLPRSNLHSSRVLTSSTRSFFNPSLEENAAYYPYAIGIKTGFLDRAGYCFVGAAERDGVELISVVFYTSASGRWTDTKRLMEYGFSQFVSMTPQELFAQNPITVETTAFSLDDTGYGRLQLNAQPVSGSRTVRIVATKTEMEAMARNLRQTVLIEYTRDFAAPIEQGEVMGTMTYYPTDGGSAVQYELVASRSIARRENAPLSLEEIEQLVYADPNPFPPLSAEMVIIIFLPVAGVFTAIYILLRVTRKTGRHRKGRVPKPKNRFYR